MHIGENGRRCPDNIDLIQINDHTPASAARFGGMTHVPDGGATGDRGAGRSGRPQP